MLKQLINSINVSFLENFNEIYNFVNFHFNNTTPEELKGLLSSPQLENFNLTVGTNQNKIIALREELKKHNANAYLISTSDEYINEYTPLFAKRLFYLTGFSGSLGYAVITQHSIALFVDGRYTQQAYNQVDTNLIKILPLSYTAIIEFCKNNLKNNSTIAINSKTFSYSFSNFLLKELQTNQLKVNFLNSDLTDNIWINQPPQPLSPISIYPIEYAGESSKAKVIKVIKYLNKHSLDAYVVTTLDDIAWLLNIRGNDIQYCPFTLANLIIYKDGSIKLFTNLKKILPSTSKYFKDNNITCIDSIHLEDNLKQMSSLKVGLCIESPYFYYSVLHTISKVTLIHKNIISYFKTIKNPIEIKNNKIAHYKDGAAFTKLILWLNEKIKTSSLTEIQVFNKINSIKQNINTYKGNSFSSIVASDSNAAFPHYDPLLSTTTIINKESILLIDCGSQYLEGTTDTTRTLTFIEPSKEFKYYFTLVLKGLIALTSIKFPINTPGRNLDVLARQFLWNKGLDYNHGTGHGVGHYLSVHEEPIRFNQTCNTTLTEGMIISIEPGFYKVNNFGIRIENLVVVQKTKDNDNFLELIPLTFIPIDKKNIDFKLLSPEEKLWLTNYHNNVIKNLTPYLTIEEVNKLKQLIL